MDEPKESPARTNIRAAGGSNEMTIPKDLIDRLEWGEGDKIHLDLKNGKYGKCLVAWCYDKQIKEYNRQNNKKA